MSKPWDYLIEGDQEIRAAERSGDVEAIIRAYKRAGQTGGATSAFGRKEIAGWNRRAAKGFKTAASTEAFVEGALSRNYAVVVMMFNEGTEPASRWAAQTMVYGGSLISYYTRGQEDPSKRFVWRNNYGEIGQIKRINNTTPSRDIRAIWNYNADWVADEAHRDILMRFAVIPRTALPRQLRLGDDADRSPRYILRPGSSD